MVPLPANLPIGSNLGLFRSVLNPSDVSLPLSAASLQASRLAACSDGRFVFSTGSDVFKVCCSPTRKRPRPLDNARPETDQEVSNDANATKHVNSDVVLEAVADDYISPQFSATTTVERFLPHCAHQSEVQSVVGDNTRVASVDMFGRCIVTIERSLYAEDARKEADQDGVMSSFVVPPVSLTDGEPGWAGVALKQKETGLFAVARQHFRDVTLYDRDVPVRTAHCVLAPGAISFCGEGNMVAVAEGSGLSFYDFRAGENGSCISRKSAGSGQLLAMDVSNDGGVLAVAGMDRIVHVFDVRTLTVRDRWPGCLKYECAGVLLSKEMEGMAYVCSVDNEVACGAWSADMAKRIKNNAGTSESLMISGANTKSPRRAFGFRGDVRLTGMVRRNTDGEELAAISEAGSFYFLRKIHEHQ